MKPLTPYTARAAVVAAAIHATVAVPDIVPAVQYVPRFSKSKSTPSKPAPFANVATLWP